MEIPEDIRREFDKWDRDEVSGQQFRDLAKSTGNDEWDVLIFWCWYRMEKLGLEKESHK